VKHKSVKIYEFYKNGKKKKYCPRCGEGTFMAVHKQENGKIRYYCGKCKLTLWE